jgi:hypothetical protein
MGSGASKLIYHETNLGQTFCQHIAAAAINADDECHHFELAYEAWRGIAEIGLRHTDMVVQELGAWVAERSAGDSPPPAHWGCSSMEQRSGGTELALQAYGGVQVALFVPDLTAEGDAAAEQWHKEVGNLARDAAALRHARSARASLRLLSF